jgi:hypothetical protein
MNTIITSSIIAKESMRMFVQSLGLADGIDMQYKSEFAQSGAKAGATVNVRKPWRPTVSTGQALNLQDVYEESSPLTIQYQDHVDFQFSSADLSLSIDAFSERYVKPAMAALAVKFDTRVAALYSKIWNFVGAPGSVPTASLTYSGARTKLNLNGAPDEGKRRMVVTSDMMANAVDAMKGLFYAANSIESQFKTGAVGTRVLGFNWSEDDHLAAHTVGTLLTTPLVAGANQTGSSIITNGWAAAIATRLKKGDCITFAGVYMVDPISFQSNGVLQQFVVTADVASDGSGNATIPISPSIILTGPTQTVTASPADGAAILTFGAVSTYAGKVSPQGLAFFPKAFTAAFVDLPLPRGADMAARISDPDLGISMRIWRDGDINTDQFPCRIDILYGLEALRPEWCVRVCS